MLLTEGKEGDMVGQQHTQPKHLRGRLAENNHSNNPQNSQPALGCRKGQKKGAKSIFLKATRKRPCSQPP